MRVRFALVLTMLSGCGTPTSPEHVCEAFLQMLETQTPEGVEKLKPRALRMKKKQCLEDNRRWAAEDPEEYLTMARCVMRIQTPAGWARCGFGLRDKK